MNTNQKQSAHKIILDKFASIIDKDINKGLQILEQFIGQEEMKSFKNELESELSGKQNEKHSMNYKRRLNSLKSCFEGLPADSIL